MEDYRIDETTAVVATEQNADVTPEISTSTSGSEKFGYMVVGAIGTLAVAGIVKGVKALIKKGKKNKRKKDATANGQALFVDVDETDDVAEEDDETTVD